MKKERTKRIFCCPKCNSSNFITIFYHPVISSSGNSRMGLTVHFDDQKMFKTNRDIVKDLNVSEKFKCTKCNNVFEEFVVEEINVKTFDYNKDGITHKNCYFKLKDQKETIFFEEMDTKWFPIIEIVNDETVVETIIPRDTPNHYNKSVQGEILVEDDQNKNRAIDFMLKEGFLIKKLNGFCRRYQINRNKIFNYATTY